MNPSQHLHATHFAFFRGLVQGLPVTDMWGRYLALEGDAQDERVVKRVTRQIREAFALLALRAGKPGSARLLRLDLRAARQTRDAQARPTLEEFILEHDLAEFSESEQVEAYESVHGRDKREHAAARLLRRQIDLINDLAIQAARKPALDDVVEAWLPSRIHNRLREAGIMTLYGLVRSVREAPKTWMNRVQGIGETKAQALVEWLRSEGLLSDAVTAVVPVSGHRDLSAQAALVLRQPGTFHTGSSILGARDDVEAVQRWLANLTTHTARAYRKEVERLGLWSALTLQKPLSSLTYDDMSRYRDFVLDPQPRPQWVGPSGMPRKDPRWRPFSGPLSPRSAAQALAVISSMYAFWCEKGYVSGNPAAGIRVEQVKRSLRQQFGARTLKHDDMPQLLQGLGDSPHDKRLRLTLQLLHATGVRSAEILGATFADLERFEDGQASAWMLWVKGKGNKVRDVPVPDELVLAAQELARLRGAHVDVERGLLPATPLLGHIAVSYAARKRAPDDATAAVSMDKAWSYRGYSDNIRKHALRVATRLQADGDEAAARRIMRMSAHWLRHTFATEAFAAGVDPLAVQTNLGHASLATTSSVYASEPTRRQVAQMQKLWGAQKMPTP
jgi:site-specific recombinase XerD